MSYGEEFERIGQELGGLRYMMNKQCSQKERKRMRARYDELRDKYNRMADERGVPKLQF